MGYPKWIDAHGGVRVCVQNEAEEEAFTNPPNKHAEVEDSGHEAPAPAETDETPAHTKKGAKKK